MALPLGKRIWGLGGREEVGEMKVAGKGWLVVRDRWTVVTLIVSMCICV